MPKTATHYVSALIRHARHLNLDVERILSDTGIPWELSQVEHHWIDNSYVTALVQRLWQETNNETMGFDPEPLRMGSWAVACEALIDWKLPLEEISGRGRLVQKPRIR